MLKLEVIAYTREDGEDKFVCECKRDSRLDTILNGFMADLEHGIYISLVITIARVQS